MSEQSATPLSRADPLPAPRSSSASPRRSSGSSPSPCCSPSPWVSPSARRVPTRSRSAWSRRGPAAADQALAALGKSPALLPRRYAAAEGREALRTGKISLLVEAGPPVVFRFDETRPGLADRPPGSRQCPAAGRGAQGRRPGARRESDREGLALHRLPDPGPPGHEPDGLGDLEPRLFGDHGPQPEDPEAPGGDADAQEPLPAGPDPRPAVVPGAGDHRSWSAAAGCSSASRSAARSCCSSPPACWGP